MNSKKKWGSETGKEVCPKVQITTVGHRFSHVGDSLRRPAEDASEWLMKGRKTETFVL